MSEDIFDLLVIGGGMTGVVAACRTIQSGGTVCLVEKGTGLGGSAPDFGFIWSAPDLDTFKSVNPDGDPKLARALMTDFEPAIQWVRDLGVEIKEPIEVLGFGLGFGADLASLFTIGRQMIEESQGSELLLNAEPAQLLLSSDGMVEGAQVVRRAMGASKIRAHSTLLATGGFAGSPELRRTYLGENGTGLPIRAARGSVGDGLKLALSVGGRFGKNDAAFYGHLMASGVEVNDPSQFSPMTFYHSEHGLLLNIEGRRFMNETAGDHLNAIGLLDQPQARALLIYDQYVHQEFMMIPPYKGGQPFNKFEAARSAGGRCSVVQTIDELKDLPEEWGYPSAEVYEAVSDFNRTGESSADYQPGRSHHPRPLADLPLYVVEVVPAITYPFGGILIDSGARVIDDLGGPIPGLLSAGGDSGGLYFRAYAGGLAPALVFGLRASDAAMRN